MKCVRSCGRKAAPGQRTCQPCSERTLQTEAGRKQFGGKQKVKRWWGAGERQAFIDRLIAKAQKPKESE